ncbi:MAG: hypothetical protein OQK82_02120 [Candidatus Pacearchaeota archaeon]|nr:hypothetical protein [Candidatus Pacearchaeota archaeon]
MVFRKQFNWRYYKKGKQEPPNKERYRPTFSFKSDRHNLDIVTRLANKKKLTQFINEAIDLSRILNVKKIIDFKRMLENNPEKFLEELIPQHYSFSKHIVRKTGRKLKQEEKECLNG